MLKGFLWLDPVLQVATPTFLLCGSDYSMCCVSPRNMVHTAKIGKIKFKYLMTIYGLCKDSSASVMEYMSRGSLDNLLTTHTLMWPKKFQMIHEVTMGMNFLHSMKPPLLHLNLKLSNVLLDDHLHVKVLKHNQ